MKQLLLISTFLFLSCLAFYKNLNMQLEYEPVTPEELNTVFIPMI